MFSSDLSGANSSDASGTTAFGYDVEFGSPVASVLMTSPLLIVVDSNYGRKGIADNDSNSPHLKNVRRCKVHINKKYSTAISSRFDFRVKLDGLGDLRFISRRSFHAYLLPEVNNYKNSLDMTSLEE